MAVDFENIEWGEIEKLQFPAGRVEVWFKDGRIISFPREWYPRLNEATDEELAEYELMPSGIHWPRIDEDISLAGIMLGYRSGETEESFKEWLKWLEEERNKLAHSM